MKLEAIDPLNLSAICAATVKKVLKMGYVMIRVDCYEEDPGSAGADWFCYHITSPYIFPCGFAARHKLVLTPPHGYTKENFSWDDYLRKTTAKSVPPTLIKKVPYLTTAFLQVCSLAFVGTFIYTCCFVGELKS